MLLDRREFCSPLPAPGGLAAQLSSSAHAWFSCEQERGLSPSSLRPENQSNGWRSSLAPNSPAPPLDLTGMRRRFPLTTLLSPAPYPAGPSHSHIIAGPFPSGVCQAQHTHSEGSDVSDLQDQTQGLDPPWKYNTEAIGSQPVLDSTSCPNYLNWS